ncbi:wax ester/triacylglycerol synthase domain-containing protein [Kitasatospora sp. HPMI-4]|uniref:wax ester/triacylglycerol synthase domain-containing protein n=1 Tax=Kitasatospora sp. HPMI-4 TaxID=3448443 RepID=UPI003F1952D6
MPPQDAWFHRQQRSGAACMTVAVLAWFEGPAPTLATLRELAHERLRGYERLGLSATQAAPSDWPRWTRETGFDPSRHIHAEPLTTSPDELVARPLDPGRPPWQLHLLPGPAGGGFALLLRAHHALLDGCSLVAILRTLLDGPPVPPSEAPPGQRTPAGPGRQLGWALSDLLPRARPLPFHGPVEPLRTLAFSRIPRAELDAARAALSPDPASGNAVFLAATSGALRRLGLTGRLPLLPGVCALVPVDVRGADQGLLLGNHYATVRVPLPVRRQPKRRLAAVHGRTHRDELRQRARAQAELVARQPLRYTPLGALLGRYVDSPRYFSVLCSSVATRASRLTLGPATATGFALVPPLGPGHPLAVTMAHHGTNAVVTAITDRRHARLAGPLADLIHEEIRSLGC